jgi:hypothetical protein
MNLKITCIAFIGLLMTSLGCNSTSSSSEEGERYYEFTHVDEGVDYSIIAKTSDPDVIAKLEEEMELPFDERTLHIHGDIERGDGGHNNWSWHFTPGEWDMVEISAEVCDGRPQMVEDDLDYWVDQVGYFCPWSSRVVGEVNP